MNWKVSPQIPQLGLTAELTTLSGWLWEVVKLTSLLPMPGEWPQNNHPKRIRKQLTKLATKNENMFLS